MKFNCNPELLDFFAIETIELRYKSLFEMMMEFIKKFDSSKLNLNRTILGRVVIDYFTSIKEIKSFHDVKSISSQKSYAYISYWILKHKPIQIVSTEIEENVIFINEKFVVTYIFAEILGGKDIGLNDELTNFIDQILYFFKCKDVSVNTIEIMITAFKAGLSINI